MCSERLNTRAIIHLKCFKVFKRLLLKTIYKQSISRQKLERIVNIGKLRTFCTDLDQVQKPSNYSYAEHNKNNVVIVKQK